MSTNPVTFTLGPFAAGNVANIVASNTPGGAGNLTIIGTTFSADKPRKVLVTFGNEASNRVIAITGTGFFGTTITETRTIASGASGTLATLQDFATVTQVQVFAAFTAAMSVGTVATTGLVGSTPWVIAHRARIPFLVGYAVRFLAGTPTYQLDLTMDDPNLGYEAFGSIANITSDNPQGNVPPQSFIDPTPAGLNGFGGASKNAAFQGQISLPCMAFRITQLTADATAQLQAQFVPAGYFGA